jgi:hypothetical protein
MNIIYLLTNKSKKPGEPRFYIGSKVECYIAPVNGRNVIIDAKSGRIYWGSSSNLQMKEDLKTDDFEASILASTGFRKDLLSTEQEFITKYNAVESEEYYNLSYPQLAGQLSAEKRDIVMNIYGETFSSFGGYMGSINKRNNTAKTLGFKNFGELVYEIYKFNHIEGKSRKDFKERCTKEGEKMSKTFFERILRAGKGYDPKRCYELFRNVPVETVAKMREMYIEGASYKKIAELTDTEYPIVLDCLHDFIENKKSRYIVAADKGFSSKELEDKIVGMVLDGKTVPAVCNDLKITTTSGYRYFYRGLRKQFKSSDLK